MSLEINHRSFLGGEFWRKIYPEIDNATFLDYKWQLKNSVTSSEKLLNLIQDLVPAEFYEDVRWGFQKAPMSVRITPYVLSLINWDNPYDDPLRRQFLPIASALHVDHPKLHFDTLNEISDSPVPGLTHRYPDKVLFLALLTCPVYCRYCTRSYAVGLDTAEVKKYSLAQDEERYNKIFQYISSKSDIEDVVVSGGDAFMLKPNRLKYIGESLLAIPHIRRIRIATKGLAIMPMKILTDMGWTETLVELVNLGRSLAKEVCIHTHFSHPSEITEITKCAMDYLMNAGVIVRNQAVLQRGVNDTIPTMKLLIKSLGYLNVHSYYVFMHDLVKGTEDLRTTLQVGLDIEKHVRGITAGFNTPTFVVDTPGGGGKKIISSYEHYNPETGISVYTAPSVKPGKYFMYFDPLYALTLSIQKDWKNPNRRKEMMEDAMSEAIKKGK